MQYTDFNMQDFLPQQNAPGPYTSEQRSSTFVQNPPMISRSDTDLPPVVTQPNYPPKSNAFYDTSPAYHQTNNMYRPPSNTNPNQSSRYNEHPTRSSRTKQNQIKYTSSSPPPITVSGLMSGQHNKMLTKYPTLHPIINPQMPQPKIIQPQRSTRVVSSLTQKSLQQMKGTSKIQFLPFNKKIVQYRQQQRVQRKPKKYKVMNYKEQVKIETIPKQITEIDYYAIQHIKGYRSQYVPQKTITMVQRAVPYKRIEYVPVTRQVYHGAPMGNALSEWQLTNQNLNPEYLSTMSQFYNNFRPEQQLTSQQFIPSYSPTNIQSLQQNKVITTTTYGAIQQEMQRRINLINDHYDTYVPAFKY